MQDCKIGYSSRNLSYVQDVKKSSWIKYTCILSGASIDISADILVDMSVITWSTNTSIGWLCAESLYRSNIHQIVSQYIDRDIIGSVSAEAY